MNHNKTLAAIFKDMSLIYQYIGGEERFRALAYAKVAKTLSGLQEDVEMYLKNNTLEEIPGVGEGIAEKMTEFINTGKIGKYEELKKTVPAELLDVMTITGFGPQSIRRIHESLGIDSKEQLVNAIEEGKLESIKGFGKKKVEQIKRALKLHKVIEERMLLWDALQLGNELLSQVKKIPGVKEADLAGSLRRRKETIGDIDILAAAEEKYWKKIAGAFCKLPFAKEVLAKGNTKASVLIKETGKQVDLRIVQPDEWGAALLYFTGSKEHNIHLRSVAKEKGLRINEYGLFKISSGEKLAGETEASIYNYLGFKMMPPEMREDKGELALAARKKIPKLITVADIKGDLQMHSNWSDGVMDIATLAGFVSKNYHYDYIVLTDHSQMLKIANGLSPKRFEEQVAHIRQLNKNNTAGFLKAGAEVDIKSDGSMDIPDEVLAQLDWVCASIHFGLKEDNTDRIVAACNNPFVNCIGHPSGRLIGQREAYPVDWKKVFSIARQTGTAFEINCQPERMDLNDELAKMAKEAAVPLVISTDAHDKSHYAFMELGVSIARRAWCTADDILNTKSWQVLEHFRKEKIKRMKN